MRSFMPRLQKLRLLCPAAAAERSGAERSGRQEGSSGGGGAGGGEPTRAAICWLGVLSDGFSPHFNLTKKKKREARASLFSDRLE